MIHQGSVGYRGNVPDLEVAAREALTISHRLCERLAFHAGQEFDKVKRDTERDYYMTAHEAKEYGLIDVVADSTAHDSRTPWSSNGHSPRP
jgi:ATP-dependent Clp protease protease subunit